MPGRWVSVMMLAAAVAISASWPAAMQAAEAGAEPAAGEQLELGVEEANALVEIGNRAMRDSNQTPSRAVDAAVAFAKALKYFEKAGATDRVCELDANIFWCKKRMNIEEVQRFLAAKGGSVKEAELIAMADQIATKEVAVNEAQVYFDRAAAFATEHPKDFTQITSRYFEVAERFPMSEQGINAKALSLEAQAQQLAQIEAERQARLETVFSKPPAPADPATQVAYPSSEELKAAIAEVKSTYKLEYAKRKPTQKVRFAKRLLDETKGANPAQYAALLSEAASISESANDYALVLTIADREAAHFSGASVAERRKQVLAEHANPISAGMIKLVDDPNDKEANLVIGKYLCLDALAWDTGIPLLARSSDPDLSAVAALELAKPEGALEQLELADRWSALAKKTFGAAKEQMLTRAFGWYQQAKPGLTGMTKERIGRLIEEIADQLPPTNVDFDKLTVKQWEHLSSKVWALPAGNQRNDIGLVLSKGEKVRIVPHPTDQWTMRYGRFRWPRGLASVFDVDWTGYEAKADTHRTMNGSRIPVGALVVSIGTGAPMLPHVLDGEGKVFVGPYLPGGGIGVGQIRVKVVVIDDE